MLRVVAASFGTVQGSEQCPPMLPGLKCSGGAYNWIYNVTTPEECCDLCSKDPTCGAFTHKGNASQCNIASRCVNLFPDHSNGNYHAGLPERLPPPPEPSCMIPSLGVGYRCEEGEEIGHATNVSSTGACCDLCKSTNGCLVWSRNKDSGACHLLKTCPHKPRSKGWTTGWAPPPVADNAVPESYRVGRGEYQIKGYKCGGGETTTVIFYPKGPGRFNVVFYGHGDWGRIDGSDEWMETMASRGFIVVAPFGGKDEPSCGSDFVQDLLLALRSTKAGGASLHPVFSQADWSRTGFFGHSKGAKYIIPAAHYATDLNVKAVLASSDVPSHKYSLDMPIMFTTGSKDIANKDGEIKAYFDQMNSTQKVYASLLNGFHMEVQEGRRLNLLTAQFLACHIRQSPVDCDAIYGDGPQSLCQVNSYDECIVVGDRPKPTPPTSPSVLV